MPTQLKRLVAHVGEETHRWLRLAAADRGISVGALVRELIAKEIEEASR